MLRRIFSVFLFALVLAGAARAEERLVVVELFTSQGCSSCPPADALLGELAESRADVLPLALHVDYWDYIGWKDEFADPKYTLRQKGYARANGDRTIYTPQMIVGGVDHVVGYKPMKLGMMIEKHLDQRPAVTLDLRRSGNAVTVLARAQSAQPTGLLVQLVRYTPKRTVSIRRGENAGHTLSYHNIVEQFDIVGRWDGKGAYRQNLKLSGEGKFAVLVQRGTDGPIVAAARVP